jgi:hypothetical protein
VTPLLLSDCPKKGFVFSIFDEFTIYWISGNSLLLSEMVDLMKNTGLIIMKYNSLVGRDSDNLIIQNMILLIFGRSKDVICSLGTNWKAIKTGVGALTCANCHHIFSRSAGRNSVT